MDISMSDTSPMPARIDLNHPVSPMDIVFVCFANMASHNDNGGNNFRIRMGFDGLIVEEQFKGGSYGPCWKKVDDSAITAFIYRAFADCIIREEFHQ